MIHVITKHNALKKAVRRLKKSKYVACDSEFTEDGLITIQVGNHRTQYVIFYNPLFLPELNTLFSSSTIKIFHNAKADLKVMKAAGIECNNICCTMINEMLLNAGKTTEKGFYGLDSLTQRYYKIRRLQKKEQQLKIWQEGFTPEDKEIIQYAADDVRYLHQIFRIQHKLLQQEKMANSDPFDLHTVQGLEYGAMHAFTDIEYHGMYVNPEKWESLATKVSLERDEVHKKLREYKDINFNSWVQKLKLLNEDLELNVQNTREFTLRERIDDHPIFQLLIDYSKLTKLQTSFCSKLLTFANNRGRVCPSIWQVLSTGRISMSKPNLQQIPSRSAIGGLMRECFIPEPGWKIVAGDYSQAELRILAHLSQDKTWLDIFNSGKDLHTELCKLVFEITDEEVNTPTYFNPDITYRKLQKNINFG